MKRKYFIGAALVFFALIFFWLMGAGQKGTIELTAPSDIPNNSEVTVNLQSGDEPLENVTLKPGETKSLKLKPGTWRVDGAADTLRSVDVIAVEGGETAKLITPSGERRGIRQVGTDASNCPVVVAGQVYSYNCNGEGTIVRHDPAPRFGSTNVTLFDGRLFGILYPYKEGLLENLQTADGYELNYVDLRAGRVQPVQLPAPVQSLFLGEQPQIVTSSEAGSSRFALLFARQNKLYAFKDANDATPLEIKPGEDQDLSQLGRYTHVSYYQDNLVLFLGNSDHEGEGENILNEDVTEEAPELPAYIFEYDAGGQLTATLKLSELPSITTVQKISDDFYALSSPSQVGFYVKEKDTLRLVYTFTEVASVVVLKGKAYIQEGGVLYEFAPKTQGLFGLHGLFSSSDITVSEIFGSPDGVLFTGLTSNSDSPQLNIYQLLAAGQANETPVIQKEPLYTGIDQLKDFGITSKQVANLKIALNKYVEASGQSVARVSASSIEVVSHDRYSTSDVDQVTLTLTFDSVTLRGTLEYAGLKTVRLFLYDQASGAQVFDSGPIGS